MRAVQTKEYLYIFNPWADPAPPELLRPLFFYRPAMHSAAMGTKTWKEMQALARIDRSVARRVDLFRHRVPEEFYHVTADTDNLHNLIDSPEHAEQIERLRGKLEQWMRSTDDHALEAFLRRDDDDFVEEYLQQQQAQSDQRQKDARQRFEDAIAKGIREGRINIFSGQKSEATGQDASVR